MYKVYMKDTLNWMKDIKLVTSNTLEVIAFFKKYGVAITLADLDDNDIIEVLALDGLKLTIMKN